MTGKPCRVTSGEHDAGNQHLVADFQRPDFFFGEGKGKLDHKIILILQRFEMDLQLEFRRKFGRQPDLPNIMCYIALVWLRQ